MAHASPPYRPSRLAADFLQVDQRRSPIRPTRSSRREPVRDPARSSRRSAHRIWLNLIVREIRRSITGATSPKGRWLLGGTLAVGMMLWDWQLSLSTSVGVGTMLALYMAQSRQWQAYWHSLQRCVRGINRRLLLAVGGGGVATLSTFLAIAVWREAEHPWTAASLILQGLVMVLTCGLVVWHIGLRPEATIAASLEQDLVALTQADPLQRLISVRRLGRQLPHLEAPQQREVRDCLQLLLTQEPESLVREAALETLQSLASARSDLAFGTPLDLPAPRRPRTPPAPLA
ncbi:hypothetical protein OOK60_07415 [Trichothermofontia sichuanensis B231]|uniref:hypothetical protein n=1 Tax=Trichothermofontia sichuanensis TaxID=3045816 RepID=UPI002245AEC3|nr:hypothetical protein [Trichothermofontia sichuanensis]UZQ55884.1 hypothetical protein OOK60_07415 [Trichothermofontia sichuanensis B231]